MYVPCAGCFSFISESSLRSDWLSREALTGFSLQPPRRPQCCPSKEDRYHLQVVVGTADKSGGGKSEVILDICGRTRCRAVVGTNGPFVSERAVNKDLKSVQ